MSVINQFKNERESVAGNQAGFSLVEVVIAVLVMTVMLLGTLTVFTYAVQYNRGNNLRSQALTVLQQQAELFRSAKFVPDKTDNELLGKSSTVTSALPPFNNTFNIEITIDNDPFTSGIQTSEKNAADEKYTLKEIKIKVSPKNAQAAWEKAIVAEAVIQRVMGN